MSYLVQFEAFLLTEKCVSSNTLSAYRSDIRQLQEFLQEQSRTLEQTTPELLKEFIMHLKKERALDARSIARKIASIRAFFSYLHMHHGFSEITSDFHIPKIKKSLPVFMTEDEIAQLLRAADANVSIVGKRNRAMLYLLYASGVRISELVHLNVADLHFDTGFMTVRGKGNKERMVPLPDGMMQELARYVQEIRLQLLASWEAKSSVECLFPTKYAGAVKYMTRQAFWVIIQDLWKKTGIKKPLSPHKLRHSLATHLLANGADLRSIQLLLGHERITTVEIYTHIETSRLREEYDEKHPRS